MGDLLPLSTLFIVIAIHADVATLYPDEVYHSMKLMDFMLIEYPGEAEQMAHYINILNGTGHTHSNIVYEKKRNGVERKNHHEILLILLIE